MDGFTQRLDALERHRKELEARTAALERQVREWRRLAGICFGLAFGALVLASGWPRPAVAQTTLDQRVAALESKLQYVTRSGTAMYFTGVNVYIRNGGGRTDSANGLGNLIVGYHELRPNNPDGSNPNVRTGSHNLIVGYQHNYRSYGGMVVGNKCQILAPYATVTGGLNNTASGLCAHVSGGRSNTASGEVASVTAGYVNMATNFAAAVSGGNNNVASGGSSSVSGGGSNQAKGAFASVSGGDSNEARGEASSIAGGGLCLASAYGSAVSGGVRNKAANNFAAVSGGQDNTALGPLSTVSGGLLRSVTEIYDWRAGNLVQEQ